MEEIKKEVIEYPLNFHLDERNEPYKETQIKKMKEEFSDFDDKNEVRLVRYQDGAAMHGPNELLSNEYLVKEESDDISYKEEVSEEFLHTEMNSFVTVNVPSAKSGNSLPNTTSEFLQQDHQEKKLKLTSCRALKVIHPVYTTKQSPPQPLKYDEHWTNDVCWKIESPGKGEESNSMPSQSTPTDSHMLHHSRMNTKIYKCSSFLKTPEKVALSTHLKINNGKLFKCDLCPYQTSTKGNFKRHTLTHTGEKPFICDLCPYQATTKSQIKIHAFAHTGEMPFKCDVCSYQAARTSDIKRHALSHTGEKPFKCDICPYQAATKTQVKTHALNHTGEKPFKCDRCPYQATTKSQVKIHALAHTGEKRFKCDLCPYQASKKSHVKTHAFIHTSDKPFKCDLCPYQAAQKIHVKRHALTHTSEKPFKCDLFPY